MLNGLSPHPLLRHSVGAERTMHTLAKPNGLSTGPLAGAFPLLSLRTNKADVAVGISQQIADGLDSRAEKWRVSGK